MIESPAVVWAERTWVLPESGETIRLRLWQKEVLRAIFPPGGAPSPFETFLISHVKKSGKTLVNGIATFYAALTFPAPETVFCVANDLAQAQERVFDLIAEQVRRRGLVRRGVATVSKTEIRFRETGTRIVALPADYAGAAGANFGVSSWTELWAYRDEAHQRLWEELTPVPNRRSLRIVDSYAGIAGDAPILEPMWTRALAGERLRDDLPIYATGRLWAHIDSGREAQRRGWLGDPAEMGAYYEEQARTLRPSTFRRLHRNDWVSGEESFITAAMWDGVVDPNLRPLRRHPYDEDLPLYVGLDIGTRDDASAVAAVAWDGRRLRVCAHRVWRPKRGETLDLAATVESYLRELADAHSIATVSYDPSQAVKLAQDLNRAGLPMKPYEQTPQNLNRAASYLYEVIRDAVLVTYESPELRDHLLAADVVDNGDRIRLRKPRGGRKIDLAAALSFACAAAARDAPWAEEPPDENAMPAWLALALAVQRARTIDTGGASFAADRERDRALGFGVRDGMRL